MNYMFIIRGEKMYKLVAIDLDGTLLDTYRASFEQKL